MRGNGQLYLLTTGRIERPGGVERFLTTLAGCARERGFEVRVFHRENSASPRWRKQELSGKVEALLGDCLQSYFVGTAVRRALGPRVRLVLSNATVGWFPLGDGVPQAHFYHGTYRGQVEAIRPFLSGRGYLRMKWWDSMVLERWSGKGKRCLVNSEQTRSEVKQFFGYESSTVWLPLDTAHFRPLARSACLRALQLEEDRPVGLYVGSVHPTKGFPAVRELVASMPELQWVLALRGEVPPALRKRSDLCLLEQVSYGQLPTLYNAADFTLCPSRYEAFGYAVAESLACGTPVVASPGGASRIFLTDPPLDRLLIQSPDDLGAFQEAIVEILGDPEGYRGAVKERVRPTIEALMAPENWWQRFTVATGLNEGEEERGSVQ